MEDARKQAIELIISLLAIYHKSPSRNDISHGKEQWVNSFDREGIENLLGQAIRQLWIPINHYYVSKAARDWWNEYAEGDIFDHFYRKRVVVKKTVEIEKYVGNANKATTKGTYEKGQSFPYRCFFHDEHIVPVCTIRDELLRLADPMESNVDAILDKIRICKMLKREDRPDEKAKLVVLPKFKRQSDDYRFIIREYYQKKNIIVCDDKLEELTKDE